MRPSKTLFSLLALSAASQPITNSSPTVVCIAGQCLQGFSNITLGAQLSLSGSTVHLLPGQYTSSTNPSLLHNLLSSTSAALSPSPGFDASSPVSLPLNLQLSPGLAVYSSNLYSGQAGFIPLPTSPAASNSSVPLPATSLLLSSNVWAAINTGSSRVVLWDAVPDISQLPSSASGALSLIEIQSSACSPPCSGSSICSASGTCVCPPGFTGASCESCSPGFFGPTCQSCLSADCTSCDEGLSGSGRCLVTKATNAPETCNCLNGACASDGSCTCTTGFTKADNGTACAKCADGFFLSSTGDCQICQLGCTQCADTTGACIACKTGFTQDGNDKTKCTASQSVTSTGTVCPDGSFGDGAICSPCSPLCDTCTGPTSNDCVICGSGRFSLGGVCVAPDANGVCTGSTMIADNNKHECDSCGAKCTSCSIPNFNAGSTVSQLQCTGCIPGSFLSQGKCVASCPSGTFAKDNTCVACDSSCSTCSGTATFCTTCSSSLLATVSGACVSTCPSSTIPSTDNKSCTPCHPDCASCSGPSFNQCSSCSPSLNKPVLSNGRCLSTCSKSQFFDTTSSTCQACDSSCSSCNGSGPSSCLACSISTQVLRAGSCVAASCSDNSSVIPGLGICLSEAVFVPQASGTSTPAPLPTITGLTDPTIVVHNSTKKLEWWEILLMALGCAFIFLVFVVCWRRRARKARAKRTREFAAKKKIGGADTWKERIARFGERLFGHRRTKGPVALDGENESDAIKLTQLRDAEEARHHVEMEKIIGSYAASSKRTAPSVLPSLISKRVPVPHFNLNIHTTGSGSGSGRMSNGSLYSQVTGMPRTIAEPRQPVKAPPPPQDADLLGLDNQSRYSTASSLSLGSYYVSPRHRDREEAKATDAQAYARTVRPTLGTGDYWIEPTPTGGSNNPFRQQANGRVGAPF